MCPEGSPQRQVFNKDDQWLCELCVGMTAAVGAQRTRGQLGREGAFVE